MEWGVPQKNADYGERKGEDFVEYPIEIQTSVSVASQDVSLGAAMRARKDFRDELGRLLG